MSRVGVRLCRRQHQTAGRNPQREFNLFVKITVQTVHRQANWDRISAMRRSGRWKSALFQKWGLSQRLRKEGHPAGRKVVFRIVQKQGSLKVPLNFPVFPVKEQFLVQTFGVKNLVAGAAGQPCLLADKSMNHLAGRYQLAIPLVITLHHFPTAPDTLQIRGKDADLKTLRNSRFTWPRCKHPCMSW